MHCLILTEEHFVRESVRLVLDVLLPTSRICAMGGRITHSVADYFVTHMKVIRQNVTLISETSSAWPIAAMSWPTTIPASPD